METGTAAAICLIGAIAATLLKQYHKEQALLCSIGVCVIVLLDKDEPAKKLWYPK